MIKSIQCVTVSGVGELYEVGSYCTKSKTIIDHIDNCSMEYPDHTEYYFAIWDKNNKQIVDIVNCPVEIVYF